MSFNIKILYSFLNTYLQQILYNFYCYWSWTLPAGEYTKRCCEEKIFTVMCHYNFYVFMNSLLYKHAQNKSYRVLSFKSFKISYMKSIPIWISYQSQTCKQQFNPTRRWYDFLQFLIDQFSYRVSCKGCLCIN